MSLDGLVKSVYFPIKYIIWPKRDFQWLCHTHKVAAVWSGIYLWLCVGAGDLS